MYALFSSPGLSRHRATRCSFCRGERVLLVVRDTSDHRRRRTRTTRAGGTDRPSSSSFLLCRRARASSAVALPETRRKRVTPAAPQLVAISSRPLNPHVTLCEIFNSRWRWTPPISYRSPCAHSRGFSVRRSMNERAAVYHSVRPPVVVVVVVVTSSIDSVIMHDIPRGRLECKKAEERGKYSISFSPDAYFIFVCTRERDLFLFRLLINARRTTDGATCLRLPACGERAASSAIFSPFYVIRREIV